LYAFTLYIAVQLATYLMTVVVGFAMVPDVLQRLGLYGWAAEMLVVGVRLLVFYATREALIQVLWSLVQTQLNPDAAEVGVLLQGRRGGAAAR
jgi:hypothetical protein